MHQDLTVLPPLLHEPPAFEIRGAPSGEVTLYDFPLLPQILTLDSATIPTLDTAATVFAVSWVDRDGDGVPDDINGDGVPDLWPQLFLRPLGAPASSTTVVPVLFNPLQFLLTLGSNTNAEVTTQSLTTLVLPFAEQLAPAADGGIAASIVAISPGEYELWALERNGEFWRVPNQLADAGELTTSSQGVRFRFVHGIGIGGP